MALGRGVEKPPSCDRAGDWKYRGRTTRGASFEKNSRNSETGFRRLTVRRMKSQNRQIEGKTMQLNGSGERGVGTGFGSNDLLTNG
jgi:hypothetical protein